MNPNPPPPPLSAAARESPPPLPPTAANAAPPPIRRRATAALAQKRRVSVAVVLGGIGLVAVAYPLLNYAQSGSESGGARPAGPDQDARRHVEKAGGFSFVVPEAWNARDFPGRKFKLIFGPSEAGFASNINVVDEAFDDSLDAYVKATTDVLPRVLKEYRLVKQDEFKTTTGVAGARLIVENEQGGKLLRQTFYIFGAPKTMFVVTCSTLAEGGEKLDAVFETSMKTFRFEKQ